MYVCMRTCVRAGGLYVVDSSNGSDRTHAIAHVVIVSGVYTSILLCKKADHTFFYFRNSVLSLRSIPVITQSGLSEVARHGR